MHQLILSRQEYKRRELQSGKRRQNFVLQRFLGVPPRDVVSHQPTDKIGLMCPNLTIIRKYIPAFGHVVELPVPCGRCLYCKHKYQNQLIYRMYNHARLYRNCLYVTLTYSDSHYIEDPEVCRKDITKYIKRVRKELNDKTFSYYMVCERGDLFNRYHFHLLLFWNGLSSKDYMCNLVRAKWYGTIRNFDTSNGSVELFLSLCSENDGHIPSSPIGHVYIDRCENMETLDTPLSVDSAVMAYVSKYISDSVKKTAFRSWSQHLGADILSLDTDLFNKMSYLRTIEYMPKDKVYTLAIPRYYKNLIFIQSERDVYFWEYLISDDYTTYLNLATSPSARQSISDNYARYEERCKNAYELRLRQKKRKYLSTK